MERHGFFSYLKEKGLDSTPFTATVSGETKKGCFSGKEYVHLECVSFTGIGDITSAYMNPHVTEEPFLLFYDGVTVELTYRSVRLYLGREYQNFYDHTNAEEAPPVVRDMLSDETAQALAAEYGLREGVNYHCMLSYEYYMVDGEDGPAERSNTVLWISDKPFVNGKPQREVTPEYRGWTY